MEQTILAELDVLEDDIHVTEDEDTMTFYVLTEQLDEIKDLFGDKAEFSKVMSTST